MVAFGYVGERDASAVRTCPHLEPLERELSAAGVAVGPGQPCPHDADWGTWHRADALFDVGRLRRRLLLDPCVTYEEYEGVLAGSDVTFYCTRCKRAIVGLHPRCVSPGTPRIG